MSNYDLLSRAPLYMPKFFRIDDTDYSSSNAHSTLLILWWHRGYNALVCWPSSGIPHHSMISAVL